MKVVSYYNVVPSQNKSQEKYDILTKFIQGVNAVGDEGILHTSYNIIDADVGVIQGWQHELGKNAPHLKLRKNVIDTQIKRNKFVCAADSNLFLYANKTNKPHHYLRYSFNGVFPNTGIYFDDKIDPKRWQQISADLDIRLEQRPIKGKYILLCCQRNGGWSMNKIDVVEWVIQTIKKIREHSDRPIVVRGHPGDKKAATYLYNRHNTIQSLSNVKVSPLNRPLEEDLHKCWAVVNHNSSSIVGPLIKGYPAFITDADKSQCAEVSHIGFKDIENPKQFDRERWLQRISMFHWKFTELEDGTAWRHMRNYCQ